jgi:hypothetical protein
MGQVLFEAKGKARRVAPFALAANRALGRSEQGRKTGDPVEQVVGFG